MFRALARRWARFTDAGRGVRLFFASGFHPRVHGCAAALVVAAGFVLDVSRSEWIALVLAMTAVLVAEAANTALEVLADAVTQEFHPLIGRAKDLGAGMVLLAVAGAVAVGILVFAPHVFG